MAADAAAGARHIFKLLLIGGASRPCLLVFVLRSPVTIRCRCGGRKDHLLLQLRGPEYVTPRHRRAVSLLDMSPQSLRVSRERSESTSGASRCRGAFITSGRIASICECHLAHLGPSCLRLGRPRRSHRDHQLFLPPTNPHASPTSTSSRATCAAPPCSRKYGTPRPTRSSRRAHATNSLLVRVVLCCAVL